MATGYLVKIDPAGEVTRHRVDHKGGPSVEQLQTLLGGYFAQVGVVYEKHKRIAYVDSDASLSKVGKPLPPVNPFATEMVQDFYPQGRTVDILGSILVWIPDSFKNSLPRVGAMPPLPPRILQEP